MTSYRIHEQRLAGDIEKIKNGNILLDKAQQIVGEQLIILEGDQLKGKTVRAIHDIVKILNKHHVELASIAKEDVKLYEQLLENAKTYMNDGNIPKEWE